MSPDLRAFKALIKARCGLQIEGHAQEKLAQAVIQRAAALSVAPVDYYACLSTRESEFQELVNLITINETYFFREPEQIHWLVNRLVPQLLAARGDARPLRILSAGCSSGEEPYSLVMALTEKYGAMVPRRFTFVAGDIDSTVLAKARKGVYTEFSFRGLSPDLKARYFDRSHAGHVLKEAVRAQVSFHEFNVLAGGQAPGLRDFDIIFFRNVSIYFDTPTRRLILARLSELLKDSGVLVIGVAETLANDLGVLTLAEDQGVYYFAKGDPPLPHRDVHCKHVPCPGEAGPIAMSPDVAPLAALSLEPPAGGDLPVMDEEAWPVVQAVPAGTCPDTAADADLDRARERMRDHHYDQALPLLDAVLAVQPLRVEALVLKAHALINRRDFATAQALAQAALNHDGWSVDALVLLGLAAKWQDQPQTAIRWFKQAVYACHGCWPAHYYLADLYRSSGREDDIELARRAYRVVVQGLSGPAPDTGLRYLNLGLQAHEIRFLCEHQLARLPLARPRTGER